MKKKNKEMEEEDAHGMEGIPQLAFELFIS